MKKLLQAVCVIGAFAIPSLLLDDGGASSSRLQAAAIQDVRVPGPATAKPQVRDARARSETATGSVAGGAPNDFCQSAAVVTNGTPAIQGDNSLAGRVDDTEALCVQGSDYDVWFQYRATCNGTVVADTFNSAQADTVLSVYNDCGGQELACNDDTTDGLLSEISFAATQGTTYWFRLASVTFVTTGQSEPGPYDLNIRCVSPVPNDDCSEAKIVTDGRPAFEGDNSSASDTDDAEASCAFENDSNKDVWFQYRATCDGIVTVDTDGSLQEDTILSAYDDCGGNEIACNDDRDFPLDFLSEMTFQGFTGKTYWIRLASYGATSGDFDLNISCCTPEQNDQCAGAKPISCQERDVVVLAQSCYTGNDNTTGPRDPVLSCEALDGSGLPYPHDASWWYDFQLPADADVHLKMCASDPLQDAVVGVFRGVCGDANEVGCDDDSCVPLGSYGPSDVFLPSLKAGEYLINVQAYTGGYDPSLPFILEVDCAQPNQEACCFGTDGCDEMKRDDCLAQGGVPQGPGTDCTSDPNICAGSQPCDDCGPGPHWIDQCAAGMDNMTTGAKLGIDYDLDCIPDTNLVLWGPASVSRSNPLDASAQFATVGTLDGHLDVIDTEMVSLQLSGGGIQLTAGAGLGQGGVLPPSLGAILEQGNPAAADSFFDIMAEVNLGGGQFAYSRDPIRVRSSIDCVPPNTTYIHPIGCFPLYRSLTGLPSDTPVANIVTADHSTFLECGDPAAGACNVPNGTPYCDDADCCKVVCDNEPACCTVGWDDVCVSIAGDLCERPRPCCLPDGSCANLTPTDCRRRDGAPGAAGALCSGDPNQCRDDKPCEDCGGADHWVDTCPGGVDRIPMVATAGLDLDNDCQADTNLLLSGPMTVRHGAGSPHQFDTEIVSMRLTGGGVVMRAGVGGGQGGILPPSPGKVVEQPNNPLTADSFFDIFVELDSPALSRQAYNQTPIQMQSKIDCVPPDGAFLAVDQCIPMYTSPIPGEGIFIGNLVAPGATTYPTQACCLPGSTCENLRPEGCRARGGIPRGPNSNCDDPDLRCVIEVDQFDHSSGQLEILGPDGFQELIPVEGPTTVQVFFEGVAEGECDDDNNNGLDDVDTEMVALDLHGISPTFGPIRVGLNQDPAFRSLGKIEEKENQTPGVLDLPPFAATGAATSFFDVYFEVQLGGQRFVTIDPKRMRSQITHKPPASPDFYENPDRIRLYDLSGRPTPYFIGGSRHRPNPPVEVDVMQDTTALLQVVVPAMGPDPIPFILRGPAVAHVFFEGAQEGDALDNDGNDLDDVQTELVSMNLTGGGLTMILNPAVPSTGRMEEQANNTPGTLDVAPFTPTGLVDSYFDVSFNLDLGPAGGGVIVHNNTPVRVQAVIDHKPPIARYIHLIPAAGPIRLFDPSGQVVGYIVRATHYTGNVEIDRFDHSLAQVEIISPTGASQTVDLSGPTTVAVFFEGSEGQADDDDGNGLDEVPTEMVALNLTGTGPLGPVRVTLNPSIPSLGGIEEQINNTPGILDLPPFAATGTADSFFDLWLQVDVAGTTLYAAQPKHMQSKITHKPPAPGDVYENPNTIPLLDAAGNPTGYLIGPGTHEPNPRLPACCLPDEVCQDLRPADCQERGGVSQASGTSCDQDPDMCKTSTPCEDCGPGQHWIDQCAAGTDVLPSGAKIGIDTNLDCIPDVSLVMSGPAYVHRSDPLDDSSNFPGSSPVDAHLDVIDTEMVSLNLTGGGMTLIAGAGLGQGGVLPPSLGAIVEQPGDKGLADSFFDIFAEVNLGGGQFGYLRDPLRVNAKIDCVPPNTTYIHPTGCFPLYRSITGLPTDTPIANIVTADHSTFLDCGSPSAGDCFAPNGNGTPYCDDEECCAVVCSTQEPDCCLFEWNATCAAIAADVCRPHQACCFGDSTCADLTETDCRDQGGVPLGDNTACDAGGLTCKPDDPCDDCGPADHWIDGCSAGTDVMPTGAKIGIDRDFDCIADTSLVMHGPVLIGRSDPHDDSVNFPGSSPVDGHKDVIDTEILSLNLTGGGLGLTAGEGMGQNSLLRPSLGAIVEQPGNKADADSFFDVFFEVDLGGGQFGYNQTPVHVATKIDCVPPDADYIHPVGCTPLYASPVASGAPIANLVTARHGTYPTCGDEVAGDCFVPNGTPFCDDATCCDIVCGIEPACCNAGWSDVCVSIAQEACPRPQACCVPGDGCLDLDPRDCRAQGGVPLGRDSACDPTHNICAQSTPCEDCGPGPHWVDQCAADMDIMPSAALIGIDTDGDCVEDMTVRLSGPAYVRRSDPRDDSLFFPGQSPVDGHLDVIDTEMISLSLSGGGVQLNAGFGNGQGGVLPGSLGTIVEQGGDDSAADSFFDIVPEIVLPGGQALYLRSPIRVTSKIDCLPPDTTYIHPMGCFPLFTTPFGSPTEVPVANLVTANHSTFPACGDSAAGNCLDPNGNGTPFCDDAECCESVCVVDQSCCDVEWTGQCASIAFDVCVTPQGCCLPDGSCTDLRAADCRARGGVPQGSGVACDSSANLCAVSTACEDCGPGPHWIDQCAAGTDIMPSGALIGIDRDLDCVPDVNVVMHGPAHVHRSNPRDDSLNFPGQAPVDGHLEVIDTEMVSLQLTGGGMHLTAGFGYGQGSMLPQSLGAIVEQSGDPASGDSFFDIMAEVDLGGGQFGYTRTPLHVMSKIDCVPPDTTYIHPVGCFPLYRSPHGSSTDTPIANIVTANHSTFPTCGDPATGACDEPNGTPYCDDAACCERVCSANVAPECCEVGWDAHCVSIAADICGQPANVRSWESIGFHAGQFGADWPLLVTPRKLDGTAGFSEPRLNGVSRLRVRFDNSIRPGTALPGNVLIRGIDIDGNPIDLSSHVVTTSTANNDTELLILVTPKLPDLAVYTVALVGVQATDGSPVGGDTERCLAAVLADVNGDIRVQANDVAGTGALVPTNPINPAAVPIHARADVNNDGRIQANDVAGIGALVGHDARRLVCPSIPAP